MNHLMNLIKVYYKPKVWVAYITTGREKYEFDTEIIGTYSNYKEAIINVYRFLYNDGKIFPSFLERGCRFEENFHDRIQIEKELYDSETSPERMEELLRVSCSLYNDDHYLEGWRYEIKEQIIN